MNGSHSKCKICQLPEKTSKALDRQLISTGNISALAQQFGVSRDSLYRHKLNHIGPAAFKGVRKAAENHGVNLLQDMQDLMETTKQILESSLATGHRSLSLKAVAQIRANTEVLGKIIFSLDQQSAQGLDPSEVAEFKKWKQDKDSFGSRLRSLPPEDLKFVQERALKQLSGTRPRFVQDVEVISEVDPIPTEEEISTTYSSYEAPERSEAPEASPRMKRSSPRKSV